MWRYVGLVGTDVSEESVASAVKTSNAAHYMLHANANEFLDFVHLTEFYILGNNVYILGNNVSETRSISRD
jgi:hypothetical protein